MALNQALNILSNEDHVCSKIFQRAEIYDVSIYQPFATRVLKMKNELNIPFDKIKPSKPINLEIWEKYKENINQNEHMNKNLSKEQLHQESLKIINKYPNFNHIYTDGSVNQNKTGIGIYSNNYQKSIRLVDHTDIFDAEAYAIFRSIETADKNKQDSIILTDSKSCVQAIYTGKTQNPIIRQIINLILKSENKLLIFWIPGHVGISGNEAADRLAKQATMLNDKTEVSISPKKIKLIIKNNMLNAWQHKWTNLNIGNEYKALVKPYETAYRENRAEEKLLSRLRCGATYITHMKPFIEKKFHQYV